MKWRRRTTNWLMINQGRSWMWNGIQVMVVVMIVTEVSWTLSFLERTRSVIQPQGLGSWKRIVIEDLEGRRRGRNQRTMKIMMIDRRRIIKVITVVVVEIKLGRQRSRTRHRGWTVHDCREERERDSPLPVDDQGVKQSLDSGVKVSRTNDDKNIEFSGFSFFLVKNPVAPSRNKIPVKVL
jgi:hypothetical protein